MEFKLKDGYETEIIETFGTKKLYVNMNDIQTLMDKKLLHIVDYQNVYKNKNK